MLSICPSHASDRGAGTSLRGGQQATATADGLEGFGTLNSEARENAELDDYSDRFAEMHWLNTIEPHSMNAETLRQQWLESLT